MSNGHSKRRRRYLAVWFPWLPSDRLRRLESGERPDVDTAPIVHIETIKGALRLVAVDPQAAQAGLVPGMTLADARARVPLLQTVAHRPDLDALFMDRILEDFGRFTPMIALDTPHGLLLDMTGCVHLFGDENGLLQAVQSRAGRAGLTLRLAMAGTPQAARALARFGPGGLFEPDMERAAIRRLPVAALELSDREEQALRRAGLKRLGDLDDRPRAPLAGRFGADFPARLARLLGDEDIRITPHRPPAPVIVDRIVFDPILAREDIERVLADLVAEAVDRLDQVGQGGRTFEAGFYRVDGHVRRIEVRTGRATRDTTTILRLFRERLAALAHPLDPGFGFDQIRMAVPVTQILAPVQRGLERETPGEEAFSGLIDRLTARLGPGSVLWFQPCGSHLPERATRTVPAARGRPVSPWASSTGPALTATAPPLRPLQIFDPPQPVETLAEVPDGSPLRFRWRRVLHDVVRAEGPERIAGEWWREDDAPTRDYYRVEDAEGRRFWLFRQGLYGGQLEPRWFIHGLFA